MNIKSKYIFRNNFKKEKNNMDSVYRNNLIFATTRERGITFLRNLVGDMQYKTLRKLKEVQMI